MKKILVAGCSMTRGHGLAGEELDNKLWVNQIFKDIGLVKNIAVTGANNHMIFLETASALSREEFDIVLVGWSAIPRYLINIGLELYSTRTNLRALDVNVNPGVTFKASWLNNVGNELLRMHNDHWDILNLIGYVNILIKLQETTPSKQILFVNTLSPWSDEYFVRKKISKPDQLTLYEQNLLNVTSRDDEEILLLYNMIHDQYTNYGKIRDSHWLNLYRSLRTMQVDNASETDLHPGYHSQDLYAEYLTPILKKKLKN